MTKDEAREASGSQGAPSFGEDSAHGRVLSPAAKRALAEAAERRRRIDEAAAARPRELDGRGGTEPVRYGDWEVKGLASDF